MQKRGRIDHSHTVYFGDAFSLSATFHDVHTGNRKTDAFPASTVARAVAFGRQTRLEMFRLCLTFAKKTNVYYNSNHIHVHARVPN